MSRAKALRQVAPLIAGHQPDLGYMLGLLTIAGQTRLAAAVAAELKAPPPKLVILRPDPEMWRTGRVR